MVRLATKPVESMRCDLQAAFKRSSDLTAAIARVLRAIGCNVVLAPEEVDAQVSFNNFAGTNVFIHSSVSSSKYACLPLIILQAPIYLYILQ